MKDEIKEILDNIKYELDNKRKFILMTDKDTEILLDYITNLQEDNAELRNEVKELERMCELYGKSIYNAELTDYKSRNEKAKSLTNRTIEIIKQQPSGNDEWILERLNGINYCLGSDE